MRSVIIWIFVLMVLGLSFMVFFLVGLMREEIVLFKVIGKYGVLVVVYESDSVV